PPAPDFRLPLPRCQIVDATWLRPLLRRHRCRQRRERAPIPREVVIGRGQVLPSGSKFGAKGGTRTPTAVNHWLLKPARLPVPPLSRFRVGSRFSATSSRNVNGLLDIPVGSMYSDAAQTNQDSTMTASLL